MARSWLARPGRIAVGWLIGLAGLAAMMASPGMARADSYVSGEITADTIWNLQGSPYTVSGDITVYGTDGPDQMTTLTIEPGVIIRFQPNRFLRIGNGDIPGRISAAGTAGARILFTGTDTQPGSWKGIFFDPGSGDVSIMDFVIVQYGGKNSGANIRLTNASPTVSNSTIRYSDYSGILCSGADSTPRIVCNEISENRYGIYTQAGADPVVHYNTIIKNSEYALLNASAGQTVNAEGNWWGSAAGPNTSGSGLNKIGGDVDFDPWLTAQPVCPVPQWSTLALALVGISLSVALMIFVRRRALKSSAPR